MDAPPKTPTALGDDVSPAEVAPAKPGRTPPSVPDYELLQRVGSGSYGDVWLARNVLGQHRAIKFIYRHRFTDPRPFEREFAGIRRFEPISRSHPSQLHILHVGQNEAEQCFYYVMELADDAAEPRNPKSEIRSPKGSAEENDVPKTPTERSGRLDPRHEFPNAMASSNAPSDFGFRASDFYTPRTLRSDLTRHGRLPPADCVTIGLSLATALAHLHDQGLVHRDIKPSNVIFVNGVAKLGDIGLVTDAGDTQSIVGTEGYLPPEGPGTPQADIYSLGKVLYEISTGLDRRRFAELPEDLRAWPDHTSVVEFNELVLRACAKEPGKRYPSAAHVRADLEWLQRGKSLAETRRSQRQARTVLRTAVAGVIGLVLVFGLTMLWRHAQESGVRTGSNLQASEAAGTRNVAAAEAYRLGLPGLRRGTTEGFRQAVQQFSAAVAADPKFVAAHGRLFECYLMSEDHGLPIQIQGKSYVLQQLAANLVKLAATNAETHAALAIVRFINEWNWTEAEAEFRQALQVDPHCRMALTYYGYFLTRIGRAREAREVLEQARQHNPESPLIVKFLGHCDFLERDYEKALESYLKASELEPSYPGSHYWAGRAYLGLTNYLQALDEFREFEQTRGYRIPRETWLLPSLRGRLATNGPRAFWSELVEQENVALHDATLQSPYFYAECHARLGETNRAMESLAKAVAQHQGGEHLLFDEFWDPFRGQQEYKRIATKIGLDPWLK